MQAPERGRAMIPTQTPARAAIYARTATVAQNDDGVRLDHQVAACRQFAGAVGASIVAEHRDVGSSASSELPGRQALLTAAQRCEIDLVLCESTDRLDRDLVI